MAPSTALPTGFCGARTLGVIQIDDEASPLKAAFVRLRTSRSSRVLFDPSVKGHGYSVRRLRRKTLSAGAPAGLKSVEEWPGCAEDAKTKRCPMQARLAGRRARMRLAL